jgi:autophagy-related protein 27
VIPIAGDLSEYGGKAFTYEATRIGNSSDEKSDSSAKEGVRLVLKGGIYEEKPQQAVVELVCDGKRTGLEDELEGEDKYERRRRADDDDKEGNKEDEQEPKVSPGSEEQLSKGDPSLVWNSYGRVSGSEEYVLHLTWKTKYACRNVPEGDGKDGEKEGNPGAKRGWGFFTWIIIM